MNNKIKKLFKKWGLISKLLPESVNKVPPLQNSGFFGVNNVPPISQKSRIFGVNKVPRQKRGTPPIRDVVRVIKICSKSIQTCPFTSGEIVKSCSILWRAKRAGKKLGFGASDAISDKVKIRYPLQKSCK